MKPLLLFVFLFVCSVASAEYKPREQPVVNVPEGATLINLSDQKDGRVYKSLATDLTIVGFIPSGGSISIGQGGAPSPMAALKTITISSAINGYRVKISDNPELTTIAIPNVDHFVSLEITNCPKLTTLTHKATATFAKLTIKNTALSAVVFNSETTADYISLEGDPSLTSISFPALVTCRSLTINWCPITGLSLPALAGSTNGIRLEHTSITSFTLPPAVNGLRMARFSNNPNLTTLTMNNGCSGDFHARLCPSLTTISFSTYSARWFLVSGDALSQATVNALVIGLANEGSIQKLNINGGTSAAPSSQEALDDIETLISNGVIVTTN